MRRSWFVLGRVPPPLGGVTVFAQRFIDRERRHGREVRQAYPSGPASISRLLTAALRPPSIVLVNALAWQLLLLAVVLFPFSKKIAVDHNHSRRYLADPDGPLSHRLRRALTISLLGHMDRVWLVSPHLAALHDTSAYETRVVSPFIAPQDDEYERSVDSYSSALRRHLKASDRPATFAISAYKLVTEQGEDLYGLNLALRATRALLDQGFDLRLIVFVADPERTPLYRQIRDAVVSLELQDHVLWEEGQKPFWPVFRHADAFLRPTRTDGWSVSVEESLAFGCPVIASDVVPRPPSCRLVSIEGHEGLERAMKDVINTLGSTARHVPATI